MYELIILMGINCQLLSAAADSARISGYLYLFMESALGLKWRKLHLPFPKESGFYFPTKEIKFAAYIGLSGNDENIMSILPYLSSTR